MHCLKIKQEMEFVGTLVEFVRVTQVSLDTTSVGVN